MTAIPHRTVRIAAMLAIAIALGLTVAGCGDDDDSTAGASATSVTGDAMNKDGDAMNKDGEAMNKDGEAMNKDGDAMNRDAAMKKDASTGDESMMSAKGETVKVGKTKYGKILQDAKGHTLYLFTKEKSKKSKCYGDCARAWPPLITKDKPVAGRGARKSKLGTTKRSNGKLQVTYNGHPLYYYVDEDEPNEVLCQAVAEFGGTWYVVNSAGNAITKR